MIACSSGRATVSIIDRAGRAAGVGDDDDARKLERRIDAARQREAGDRAGRSRAGAVSSRTARDWSLARRAGFISGP